MQVTPSSYHNGGVHALTGDGAVHFTNDSVDLGIWRALGTRRSSEVLSSPFGN
jgi:hypothetical protein